MVSRNSELQKEWAERAQSLGNSRRSVLFKRFPACLNNYVHRQHRDFILENMPDSPANVLDIGCGYGRMSREIRKTYPTVRLAGIELCEEFAIAYRDEFGSCFNGPLQEFQPTEQYDVIIAVTVLMYLNRDELVTTVEKYWSALSPGGVMICIEPAIEFLNLWRRLTGRSSASPTGGSVLHFDRGSLHNLFANLPHAKIQKETSVTLLPGLASLALHHGVTAGKAICSPNNASQS